MRNNKLASRVKINSALQVVDRQISKTECEVRKLDPHSGAFERLTSQLHGLRQKRAKLYSGGLLVL